MKELSKQYDASKVEDALYKKWEASGLFSPDVCAEKGHVAPDAKPYSIVLPPPNVTGTLHMGHAVMLAIQDVLIRYHRMKGDKTLWIPGTDHAAVATESKVEGKLIKEEGFTRPKEELGRDAFLERVRAFAQDSHDTIVNQAKKMGASLDWSREAYTLDDARNLAVRTMFKQMYDDGLIYRGYRVVNWSVKGQSTCSDDELVMIERPAKLYTFTYGPECPIAIATTRPETKLGDTAIAVHPDGRWKEYIGQTFTISDFGQSGHTLTLKVIGDEGVEDDFGTGALGVTPAHSAVDFEMYTKQKALGNDIGLIAVIGEDGKMTTHAGSDYAGLSVGDAKEKIVSWLRESGRLQKEEDITQNVGTSDRFSDVVEPLPKTQWFIDVNKKIAGKGIFAGRQVSLKEMMQEVVRGGHTRIVPDRFEKTYFHWIDNLRDWCISRQIWFGHQIPVWYHDTCQAVDEHNKSVYYIPAFVGEIKNGENNLYWCKNCGGGYESINHFSQDPDTLDTWFSSGLWTFSTLGWPNETDDLKTYHPTAVLETGYDILFFWVARMILMTTYAIGDVPFKDVYLHGLVRDEQGRKMSKTLGNIIDPLQMIEKYGTDATRLSLLIGGSPGNDVKLSEEKIAGFRNFTNKLWNISRFMLLNIDESVIKTSLIDTQVPQSKTLADDWILEKMDWVISAATKGLEQYQFSLVGEMLRDFTWNDIADEYLEIAKKEGGKDEILVYLLRQLLKLWHPYMPFVTEQIWQEVYGKESVLMVQKWPQVISSDLRHWNNSTMPTEMQFTIIRTIASRIRSLRAEQGVEPSKKITVFLSVSSNHPLFESLSQHVGVISSRTCCERDSKRGWLLLTERKTVSSNHPLFESLSQHVGVISSRTNAELVEIVSDVSQKNGITFVESGIDVCVDVSGAIDVEKEKARIAKELAEVEPYITQLESKLAGDFAKNAPPMIVEKERQKLKEAKEKLQKLLS